MATVKRKVPNAPILVSQSRFPPKAPTLNSVVVNDPTHLGLSGISPPNDGAGIKAFFWERSPDLGTTWQSLTSTLYPTLSLADPVIQSVVESYRCRAQDNLLQFGAYSNVVTAASSPTPPVISASVVGTSANVNIVLGSASTIPQETVLNYDLLFSTNGGTSFSLIITRTSAQFPYVWATPGALGTSYVVAVQARSSSGLLSPLSNQITVQTVAATGNYSDYYNVVTWNGETLSDRVTVAGQTGWSTVLGIDGITGFKQPVGGPDPFVAGNPPTLPGPFGGNVPATASAIQIIGTDPLNDTTRQILTNQPDGPTGPGSSYLLLTAVNPYNSSVNTQNSHLTFQGANGNQGMLYIRKRIWIDPALTNNLPTGGFYAVCEAKTPDPSFGRVRLGITKQTAGGNLNWDIGGDYFPSGSYSATLSPFEDILNNTSTPVPTGLWITVEFAWFPSTTANGWVWFAINGSQVYTRTGQNQATALAGVNLNRVFEYMLYTNATRPISAKFGEQAFAVKWPADASSHPSTFTSTGLLDPAAPIVGDKYVSNTGNDTTGTGAIGSPYKTIAKAWSTISNGQTVVMLTDITENLNGLAAGINGSFKRLAGQTPVKVLTCSSFVAGTGPRYTTYQNIEIKCSDQIDFQASSFTKAILCGFVGGPPGTNVGNVESHIAGTDSLYENCYFPGVAGRYASIAYQVSRTLYRWCVFRTEANVWGPPGSNPCAALTIYSSTDCTAIQCVAVDCLDQGNGSEWLAGFNLVANVGASSGVELISCIADSLDTFMPCYQTDGSFAMPATLTNCIGVRSGYGFVGGSHNSSLVSINGGEFSANANDGIAAFGPGAVKVTGVNTTGNSGSNLNGAQSVSGNTTNAMNQNTRLSAMKQIGVAGTMRGDAGWNTVQTTDMFPFPNEAIIRTRMGLISARGFCSGTNTLTSYLKR